MSKIEDRVCIKIRSSIIKDVSSTKELLCEALCNKFQERAEFGLEKYKVTLEREDLSTLDWLKHLLEEVMDAINYIEVLLSIRKDVYLETLQNSYIEHIKYIETLIQLESLKKDKILL